MDSGPAPSGRPGMTSCFSLVAQRGRRFDGPAGLRPSRKTARDMSDRFEAHVLRRLRGQRRAQSAAAEEDELLVLRKLRLVIRACRVDPEFQHAARAMEGAGHAALALQFADVADIDQKRIVAADKLDRGLDG